MAALVRVVAAAGLLGSAAAYGPPAYGPPAYAPPDHGPPSYGPPHHGPPDHGPSHHHQPDPFCPPSYAPAEPTCHFQQGATPSYHFKQFTYPPTPTPTTSVVPNKSGTPTTTYGPAYSAVSSNFAHLSTTSWGNWVPQSSVASAADASNPYGNAAFSALWDVAQPMNFSRGLFSTTVSPTPVPSSELQSPPNLYVMPSSCYKFPKDFVFGIAGSAAQCEGAVADEGKSPSIQDLLYNLMVILGGGLGGAAGSLVSTNGATSLQPNYVALEHYYLYKQDINRLAALGIKYYSFSIPWTRILPFTVPGTPVNSLGLQHYDDVVEYVYEKGMKPIVTLTHFDTPLELFGGGAGWLAHLSADSDSATYGLAGISFGYDNSTFIDAYTNYAKIVLSHFADRVPYWITFNEPQLGSTNGLSVNNVLMAHANAYRYYKEVLKGTGKVSIKMGITPAVPQDYNNQSHIDAAMYFNDVYIGAWMNPLALGQDYPEAYKLTVPDFVPLSEADIAHLNGTLDFTSLDAYVAPVIYPAVSNLTACATNVKDPAHNFPFCVNASTTTDSGWSIGYSPFGSATNYDAPLNLRTQLKYAYNTWKLPVFISEFGLSIPPPPGGRLQDNLFNVPQSQYFLSYLTETLNAIWEDGVDVLGALVWNFADDWEFGTYFDGFGFMMVNFTTQERHYRRSAFDVMAWVAEHSE